ncbi:hypothetical protein HZI73_20920 [Vallitalea pronyensis]|uniref:Uncharacterized protein n=1 Tax=Vallitalea pronyensis TaxID=1348613 RepID=A0A8J8MN61_9FIRM|nr:hypothetical protein [Vallitalea pronyensis]QUI24616.1 hypothetical protein HZI73_20920 [Vallitalea pronyensis]
MEVLHERLLYLENKVKEQQRLNKRYHKVLKERHELIQKRDQQQKKLERDMQHKEKLHKFTLENIIYTIFLLKEKKRLKEEQEAMVAKLKYDSYVKAIGSINREIDAIKHQLSTYEVLMDEYRQAVKIKEKKILLQETEEADRLSAVNNRIVTLKSQNQEMKEAYIAGEDLRFTLKKAEALIEKVQNLGFIQIRNGGILGDEQKNSIGENLGIFFDIQKLVRKYLRELGDIAEEFSEDVHIEDYLTYVHYWLDGLFEEMIAEGKLEGIMTRVEGTRWDVIDLNRQLHHKRLSIEEEILKRSKERKLIIGHQEIL